MHALTLDDLNERLSTLGQDTPKKGSSKCADGPKLSGFPLRYCDQCDTQVPGSVLDCQDRMTYDKSAQAYRRVAGVVSKLALYGRSR